MIPLLLRLERNDCARGPRSLHAAAPVKFLQDFFPKIILKVDR